MTMIAGGGGDGEQNTTRGGRRPAIRPRAITPARTARASWTLPPPRVPVARAPRRPVLMIVDEEESGALVAADLLRQTAGLGQPAELVSYWNTRRTVSALAAAALLVVVAAMIGRHIATLQATPASKTPVVAAEPAVPVFDVNSLPSAK